MTDMLDQEMYEAEKSYIRFFSENVLHSKRLLDLVDDKVEDSKRIIIDINELRAFDESRARRLLTDGFTEVAACRRALVTAAENLGYKGGDIHVGVEGSFGANHVTPRSLCSEHLGSMVCVEGIVTRMSSVKSKLERSVHYCPATNKHTERKYTDMTSLEPHPSIGSYPTKDDQGNILETEFGLCSYKDHQTFTIQEMPEHTPAGQLPRFAEVVLEYDLIDNCKAGDRVYVTGLYRVVPGKKGGFTTATFRSIVIANNVYQFTKQASINLNGPDYQNIIKMSRNKDVLDILTRSVAPSICGHEFIKRAILCQLLGGVERILTNGSRIRGDINLLLLGDPSTAKSQFLRFVLQCARDRAIATTGRGSSGVGLTAAVTVDRETGERNLDAGAMVLADRGIVCIDEFDKMSDIDRTAIHEVMEQGRVTISKAGIQAKLNARCSVLAAANPVYGRYDQYKTPMENIGLQDSLLSRFDLLFIVLDQIEEESDRFLSEFVVKTHQYRAAGEEDGYAMPLQGVHNVEIVGTNEENDDENISSVKGQIFEDTKANVTEKFFTKDFFEKYIQVARQLKPKLSKEASKILVNKYCDLRAQETEMAENVSAANRHRTQPVTARTLETLIRLATAHAKCRMKKVVSSRDAEAAADLVSFVMFKEVLKKTNKRSKPTEDDSEEENAMEEENTPAIDDLTLGPKPKKMKSDINEDELSKLTKLVSKVFDERHETDLLLSEIITYVTEQTAGSFSEELIKIGLQKLHDKNRLMLSEDQVFMM